MQLEPGDIYDKLEFDKIIDLLEGSCYGERGRVAVQELKPSTDLEQIDRWLAEVDEFKRTLERRDNFPIGAYQEIAEELRMLEIEGFVLPEEGLQKLNVLLLFIRDIYRFFTVERQEAYLALYDIIRPVEFNEELLQAIEQVIDEDGNIRPDASPELQKIRRHIQSKYREMDRQFKLIIDNYRKKAQLALRLNAVRPRTQAKPTLAIVKGRHPLLFLKNKDLGRKTIPFDLSLFGKNRILVLSGPNAGGKSITMKSGRVLKYARKRIGSNERAVDDLLVDLQREKQEVEEKLAELQNKQATLDRLTKTYEQLHRDLEYRRKKHKLEKKEEALQQTAQENREMERLIRELKEEKNLEKAKKVALKIKYQRQELSEQVGDLREDIYHPETEVIEDRPLEVGDHVRLKTGGATGEIESIDRKNAIVIMGGMRMTVKLRDLQLAKTPLSIRSTQSVHSDVDYAARFDSKIDIRGMRYVEAVKVIEEFVDQAILADASSLRIVHGKGNGSLRKAVKKKLREYNVPMEISHPEAEAGGDGVTLVQF
eukprot:g140.t1